MVNNDVILMMHLALCLHVMRQRQQKQFNEHNRRAWERLEEFGHMMSFPMYMYVAANIQVVLTT